MSNIGFLVPGIQIYLPLSPTLMLGAWCFSWAAKITDGFRTPVRWSFG